MTESLIKLNECIKNMRQTALDLKDSNVDEKEKFEIVFNKIVDATLPLYDVYMDNEAFVYMPYMFNYEQLLTEEEGLTKIVFTIDENELPELENPEIESYKKVLFKDVVDFVYAGMDTWNLDLNLGTFYFFELYDWQIEYIMARKNGANEYKLLGKNGEVDRIVTW